MEALSWRYGLLEDSPVTGETNEAKANRYLAEADAVTGECLTVDSGEQYGHVRDRFAD